MFLRLVRLATRFGFPPLSRPTRTGPQPSKREVSGPAEDDLMRMHSHRSGWRLAAATCLLFLMNLVSCTGLVPGGASSAGLFAIHQSHHFPGTGKPFV